MFESMGEHVAIWNAALMLLILPVSLNGKDPVTVFEAIRAAAIQSGMEIVTDICSTLALKLTLGVDILEKAKNRFWYWSLPTSFVFMYFSTASIDAFMGTALCHKPSLQGIVFAVCNT